MSQSFYGSLCLSDLIDAAKKSHSAFSKAENGKIYVNVNVWLNDELDKFGNIMSVQLNPKKELVEQDGRAYIGNMKKSEPKQISQNEVAAIEKEVSDLPF